MIPIGPERHVRTVDLLRFVDGEGNAAFRERVTAHLAECADCTAESARLRADSARVLDHLKVLDDDAAIGKLPATFAELAQRGNHVKAASPVVSWRRAAAIILFLGAGAAAARPAAAWLQRFIDARRPAPQVTATQSAPAAPATATLDTTTAAYTFSAGSHELRVEFAGAEPNAELAVRVYDENAASLALQSTAALPPVLILPNGVTVANGTSHGTRYDLALPRNVDVLVVSIAGHAPQRISAGSLPARIRLNEER